MILKQEDMNDMSKIRPGIDVKNMLLYFPNVNQYKTWKDYSTAYKDFIFEERSERVTDNASKWIELES
jgi:hypothetical protein